MKSTRRRIGGAMSGVLVALGVVWGADRSEAATNITVLAENMALTGFADPGGIVGDGAGTTTNLDYVLWNSPGNPLAPSNVVLISTDATGNPINARGGVTFTLNQSLADGTYQISALLQPNNIQYDNSGGFRGESFAVLVFTSGGAKLNGVANGSPGWMVFEPNYNDSSHGGATPPWQTITLAGTGNPNFITGGASTIPEIHLQGVDGSTGKLNIDVLEGTGFNYGFINVGSFTFTIPEPSIAALIAVGGLLLTRRVRK